ncbi:MAG TPA: hypothetical protein VMM13_20745, partial [Euzebya sp.]|nr:hypothetical protein [Euzebya sp.]
MTQPADTAFDSRFGRLELRRFPTRPGSTLRAWDAADDYVLDAVADLPLPPAPSCLVVGDRFGAIAVGLAAGLDQAAVTAMSDSWLSH